ncbi:MAG: hypothetical protein ACNS60_19375 [Candidatus Cyclobacteriaceae bacterium M2_1C_046]
MKIFYIIVISLISSLAFGQSANAPLSDDYYHWVDRWEIRTGQQQDLFQTSFKPYSRKLIGEYLSAMDSIEYPAREKNILQYLKRDNWEWVDTVDNESKKPFLKYFWRKKSDFLHVQTEDFDLHVNPILHFSYGKDLEGDYTTYRNTRGIRIRGTVDERFGFYSYLTENQIRTPDYVRDLTGEFRALPHVGFFKGFKEDGYDFFDARGYLSYQASKHINLQMGHDKFKIGNGYRSMILSDHAPAYFFLKMETRVWKINYTNLFTKMVANNRGVGSGLGDKPFPEKYAVFHHLGIDIGKKLNVGLFEGVMIGATDTTDADLEIEYLNPIIFYRAIEHNRGSGDNALVGMDFQYLPIRGVSLYGQLVLDEFKLEHLRAGDGWWANKFGVQLGSEWINAFGIPTLDLQAEMNLARPFTYSHTNTANSYSHFRQPLAHPLGANFKEYIFIVRYQPVNNLFAEFRLIHADKGLNPQGENFGGNILITNVTREKEFGNEIGQGIEQNLSLYVFQLSYMLKHNLFIDAGILLRSDDRPEVGINNQATLITGGLRWNIFPQAYDF